MPIDPFDPGTSVAQEFTAQEPDAFRHLAQILAANKREMFDIRASVLANVSDIVADLTATVATLTATVADLASRVTVTATIPTFNTLSLPDDGVAHNYGADIPITIAVPTGKLLVTVGCGDASTYAGGMGFVRAEATFSISGGIANYGDVFAEIDVFSPTSHAGTSLAVQHAFTVPPGTYTITGKMRAAAVGTTTGYVNFNNPYLTVQVTG